MQDNTVFSVFVSRMLFVYLHSMHAFIFSSNYSFFERIKSRGIPEFWLARKSDPDFQFFHYPALVGFSMIFAGFHWTFLRTQKSSTRNHNQNILYVLNTTNKSIVLSSYFQSFL